LPHPSHAWSSTASTVGTRGRVIVAPSVGAAGRASARTPGSRVSRPAAPRSVSSSQRSGNAACPLPVRARTVDPDKHTTSWRQRQCWSWCLASSLVIRSVIAPRTRRAGSGPDANGQWSPRQSMQVDRQSAGRVRKREDDSRRHAATSTRSLAGKVATLITNPVASRRTRPLARNPTTTPVGSRYRKSVTSPSTTGTP
jgi:hypothetical protein